MTRATDSLYMTCCGRPSKFIADITPEYLRLGRRSRIASFYNVSIEHFRYRKRIQQPHSAEEKIPQWVIAELVSTYGYPLDSITIEFPVKSFSQKGYVDIALQINKESQAIPFIFIETKRRGHSLDDALDQVKSYLSHCHLCECGAVTDGRDLIVINRRFEPVDDLPVFRNTWGLSNTIRCAYRHLKTGRQTILCYDPNQPTTIELDDGGECEFVDKNALERFSQMGNNAILLAENPKYDPIMLKDAQVRIMGVAVGVIKNSFAI